MKPKPKKRKRLSVWKLKSNGQVSLSDFETRAAAMQHPLATRHNWKPAKFVEAK